MPNIINSYNKINNSFLNINLVKFEVYIKILLANSI